MFILSFAGTGSTFFVCAQITPAYVLGLNARVNDRVYRHALPNNPANNAILTGTP